MKLLKKLGRNLFFVWIVILNIFQLNLRNTTLAIKPKSSLSSTLIKHKSHRNLWGIIKNKIREIEFSSIDHLKIVKGEWESISEDIIKKTIDDIANRFKKVIELERTYLNVLKL